MLPRDRTQNTPFMAVPVGALFWWGGILCLKRSSRTARMIVYGRTFYWRQQDQCALFQFQ